MRPEMHRVRARFTRIWRLASILRRAHDGVAAVEFALMLPLLAFLLFGSAEVSVMLLADRKITSLANVVGDLVAQDDQITAAELTGIFDAAASVLQPFQTTGLCIVTTSVILNNSNQLTVDWSRENSTSIAGCIRRTTPPALNAIVIPPGGSVVVTEVRYPFQPITGFVLSSGVTLEQSFVLRPRRTDRITIS